MFDNTDRDVPKMEPGEFYPVCNCMHHDMLEFVGIVEEHATSNRKAGPFVSNGKTLNEYAVFNWPAGKGVVVAKPELCRGGILAFSPVAYGDSLASCSLRLTYRLKK